MRAKKGLNSLKYGKIEIHSEEASLGEMLKQFAWLMAKYGYPELMDEDDYGSIEEFENDFFSDFENDYTGKRREEREESNEEEEERSESPWEKAAKKAKGEKVKFEIDDDKMSEMVEARRKAEEEIEDNGSES